MGFAIKSTAKLIYSPFCSDFLLLSLCSMRSGSSLVSVTFELDHPGKWFNSNVIDSIAIIFTVRLHFAFRPFLAFSLVLVNQAAYRQRSSSDRSLHAFMLFLMATEASSSQPVALRDPLWSN